MFFQTNHWGFCLLMYNHPKLKLCTSCLMVQSWYFLLLNMHFFFFHCGLTAAQYYSLRSEPHRDGPDVGREANNYILHCFPYLPWVMFCLLVMTSRESKICILNVRKNRILLTNITPPPQAKTLMKITKLHLPILFISVISAFRILLSAFMC